MKLTVNREYATRHLFVVVLMTGLSCWFGYDGFVRYPATPPAALYESIEGKRPLPTYDLAKFKAEKTGRQKQFAALAALAALVVGLRLLKSCRFAFEFDDEGFVYRGKRHAYADVRTVDRSKWMTKGIVKVDGIVLDSWHHIGVKEFLDALEKKS